jgi:hypothetical protein
VEVRDPLSSARCLEAWVKTSLQDNTDTVIELRYGDPVATQAPDAPGVFSNGFHAVWHLDDSLANNNIADARNQRMGNAGGGLGTNDQKAAQLGGGIDFDGNNKQIQFTNPFAGGGDHTFSAWVSQRNGTNFDTIVIVGNPMSNQSTTWGLGGNTTCALNGTLDEVRLSSAERSAGWVATEYANQKDPATFYTVGPEVLP